MHLPQKKHDTNPNYVVFLRFHASSGTSRCSFLDCKAGETWSSWSRRCLEVRNNRILTIELQHIVANAKAWSTPSAHRLSTSMQVPHTQRCTQPVLPSWMPWPYSRREMQSAHHGTKTLTLRFPVAIPRLLPSNAVGKRHTTLRALPYERSQHRMKS